MTTSLTRYYRSAKWETVFIPAGRIDYDSQETCIAASIWWETQEGHHNNRWEYTHRCSGKQHIAADLLHFPPFIFLAENSFLIVPRKELWPKTIVGINYSIYYLYTQRTLCSRDAIFHPFSPSVFRGDRSAIYAQRWKFIARVTLCINQVTTHRITKTNEPFNSPERGKARELAGRLCPFLYPRFVSATSSLFCVSVASIGHCTPWRVAIKSVSTARHRRRDALRRCDRRAALDPDGNRSETNSRRPVNGHREPWRQ